MEVSEFIANSLSYFPCDVGSLVTFSVQSVVSRLPRRTSGLVSESIWSHPVKTDHVQRHLTSDMGEHLKGPFIVIRDLPSRSSPTSYSSNGNGSETGQSTMNGNGNGNGAAWIFSELELAVEANPPLIIVDSAYADEIAKNIYRGNLCRIFTVVGSLASAILALPVQTLPASVPLLSMTLATAGFYGILYLRDPAMKYVVLGRKWQTNGFVLNPELFQYTEQPPLVLRAANSRFRRVLRVVPVVVPLASLGVVLWRFWKVLS